MTNLSTIVKVSKLLSENKCTYNDVEDILTSLLEHYRKVRKGIECNSPGYGEVINAGSYQIREL